MEGWVCPQCHATWAPFVVGCANCTGRTTTVGNVVAALGKWVAPPLDIKWAAPLDTCAQCGNPRACPGGTRCPPGSHQYGTVTTGTMA